MLTRLPSQGPAESDPHLGEQVWRNLLDRDHGRPAIGEKTDQRVENTDRQPHVAQGLGEHPFLLLFDKVRRTFEAADTQHGCGETEKQRMHQATRRWHPPIAHKQLWVPDNRKGREGAEHRQSAQVQEKDPESNDG